MDMNSCMLLEHSKKKKLNNDKALYNIGDWYSLPLK